MEKSQLRILLVEDSVDDAELLVRLIKKVAILFIMKELILQNKW